MRNHLLPFRLLAALVAALAFAPVIASAQILVDVPDVTASPGEGNVILTVNMENQVPFSGFQLDLNYPVQVAIPGVATAGSQTASAGWSVYSNLTANGTFIIAFSMNSTPITPGTGPVATVEVAILPSAIPGSYPIEAANVIISDPQGVAIPATLSSGVLTILGAGDDDDSAAGDDDDDTVAGDDDDDSATSDDDDDDSATTGDDDDSATTGDDDDSATTGDDDDSATTGDDDDTVANDDDDDSAPSGDDDDDAPGDDDDSADGRAGGCSCSTGLSDSALPGAATLLALTALGVSRRRRLSND